MITKTQIEEKEFQATGYSEFELVIRADPSIYHSSIVCKGETDNTTPEVIINDILKRYSDAWKRLAKL